MGWSMGCMGLGGGGWNYREFKINLIYKNMDWQQILETVVPLLILAVITGIGKIIYNYRKSILVLFEKQKLKILPVNFNIALSLYFKEGLNSGNYFDQIKKNLLNIIDETGLSSDIKINDLSNIQQFKDTEEAEAFRNKKNIDLIIWGGFSNDVLKIDGKSINEINLKFTFGCPSDKDKKIGSMVLLDINSKLALRNYWKIIDDNSMRDIKIVSNNIFDISTYILGLTLKLYGYIGKSINLFEHLYNNLNLRKDNFKDQIIPHLLNCYEIMVFEAGIYKKNYPVGKKFCRKILNFKENDFFALSSLALFQYKTGEKLEAEKNVELLLELYPRDPLTELDVAFFRIIQKNYSNAFKHYSRLVQFDNINFNFQEAIEFLDIEYKQLKDPALLYGSGIISEYFGDKKIAKDDLKKFIKKADENKYKKMYRHAKRLLNQNK